MPQYKISFTIQGSRIDVVKALIEKAFGKEVAAQVSKVGVAQSRADRLSEAESSFEDAKSEVESLRDEMQEWHDSIPENLQDGSKAEEVQEAIDGLESILNEMDNCEFSSVSFPGMF